MTALLVRKELIVEWDTELRLMNALRDKLLARGLNASNVCIVTVSTDYSSVIGQYLRHQLTDNGEICHGFGVDVPYPDQPFDDACVQVLCNIFKLHRDATKGRTILLVEAGVIRGGNYARVVDVIRHDLQMTEPILTLAMFENVHSKWTCDFVGEYYDDSREDLTFWWEQPNNHWIS